MVKKVPVSFKYNGELIHGELGHVAGGGSCLYHLMVNGYYWGQLNKSENFGWAFSSNTQSLEHLSEYFGDHVMVADELTEFGKQALPGFYEEK